MVTGIYPFEHGITGNDVDGKNQRAELDVPMREAFHKHPSFIRMLTENGYLTHQSGKWWEGSFKDGGFTHGMTHGDPKRGGRHGDAGLTIGREGIKPVTDFIDMAAAEEEAVSCFGMRRFCHIRRTTHLHRLLKKYTRSRRVQWMLPSITPCVNGLMKPVASCLSIWMRKN